MNCLLEYWSWIFAGVRRHGSDLRDMVGASPPISWCQCVIQEMKIQLCLHRSVWEALGSLLLLHLILHALLQFSSCCDIKVPGHLSQLVLSVGDDPDSKVSFLQCTHGRIHPFDRTGPFYPAGEATKTHRMTLMVSITINTLYMEFNTSVENTLGQDNAVYNPLSPSGWTSSSPARYTPSSL